MPKSYPIGVRSSPRSCTSVLCETILSKFAACFPASWSRLLTAAIAILLMNRTENCRLAPLTYSMKCWLLILPNEPPPKLHSTVNGSGQLRHSLRSKYLTWNARATVFECPRVPVLDFLNIKIVMKCGPSWIVKERRKSSKNKSRTNLMRLQFLLRFPLPRHLLLILHQPSKLNLLHLSSTMLPLHLYPWMLKKKKDKFNESVTSLPKDWWKGWITFNYEKVGNDWNTSPLPSFLELESFRSIYICWNNKVALFVIIQTAENHRYQSHFYRWRNPFAQSCHCNCRCTRVTHVPDPREIGNWQRDDRQLLWLADVECGCSVKWWRWYRWWYPVYMAQRNRSL